MSFIVQHSIPIIVVLSIIILLLVAVIIILYKKKNNLSYDEVNIPSDCVSKEKHKKILGQLQELRDKCKRLESSNSGISDYYNEYVEACAEKENFKKKNDELSREIIELKTLLDKYKERGDKTPTLKKQERGSASPTIGSQVIMYASFPRSAGSNIYFSDLTNNLADDSYFELKSFDGTDEAIFRPLDFMKIRNYDPAMAAITTEGVKPNVASTILSIEPGKAHLEGKDWIIDNPAKIKLA